MFVTQGNYGCQHWEDTGMKSSSGVICFETVALSQCCNGGGGANED